MEDQVGGRRLYRWKFGDAEFDEARWQLTVRGVDIDLERRPLEVLALLLRHAGEVLTKDELLGQAWTGRVVVEAALTNAVGKLRKALGDDDQTLIVTVPRVGYRLDVPATRKVVEALPPQSVLAQGDAVPRRPNWRLTQRLARNADSEVWLAEQPKSREQRVFKFSLDGARLYALKREVTLSRLLHDALGERPDFVKLIDWDFEQAPYFVEFEYGGEGLDQWLERNGPAIGRDKRLELLARIADALAAAHDLGVIHKDLKPANVLVHQRNAEWIPRLTDFGSGRLLETGQLDALGITRLGLTQTQSITSDSRSGTPLYLAPELLAGHSPSVRSDLYALGVILYQLLVDDFRKPLAPGWEADIDDQLLREDIADFANGDPTRRPASARDLAERLRELPARRVRRDTERAVAERIAEGERRLHAMRARRPFAIAAFVLLLAGLGASLFFMQRANQAAEAESAAARQAEQARVAAEKSLRAQEQWNQFVTRDIINASSPDKHAARQITVKEALLAARTAVPARFGQEPAIEGQIHLALGRAFGALRMAKDSTTEYQRASELLSKSLGAADEKTIEAQVFLAIGLIDAGNV